MDVKKIYWYNEGEEIISSRDIPPHGTKYLEKTISVIGVPYLRAVSIKNSKGELLYNNLENIPLENNLIEKYLMEVHNETRIN
jgi:hypothetical protein